VVTAKNFKPLTDEEIKKLYKHRDIYWQDASLEEFTKEVRDEEASVEVLLGLGFEVEKK
jgi:hypothetical protein